MQKQRSELIIIVLILISILPGQSKYCNAQVVQDNLYLEFEQLVKTKQNSKAMEIGHGLFQRLVLKYPENASLHDLQRRLKVAKDLAELISRELKSRQKKSIEDVIGLDMQLELPSVRTKQEEPGYLLAPAEQLYWTHLESFSHEVNIKGVSATESNFLRRYYCLRMQSWIEEVATNVTRVIVTNPDSSDLSYYSFVLPLLYICEQESGWNKLKFLFALVGPDNLDAISDFCLLRVDRPSVVFAIAEYKVISRGKSFSSVDWALAASTKCVENHRPDLAEKLLTITIDTLGDKEKVIELRLRIAEYYGKCGDNMTAIKKIKQIATEFPDSLLYGKIMSSYFAYLARLLKAEEILAEIDAVLESPSCQKYLSQLIYLKWWALRKTNQQVLAKKIGEQLIEDYEKNPHIAPVLLAHATDALSNQQYDKCRKLLVHLTKNFPRTSSAKQALEILARLDGK
jgi:outer membrane protein assembly factor BamD (BamD/ComL family)